MFYAGRRRTECGRGQCCKAAGEAQRVGVKLGSSHSHTIHGNGMNLPTNLPKNQSKVGKIDPDDLLDNIIEGSLEV